MQVFDTIYKAPHRLLAGRENADHPAIKCRNDRVDLALEGIQRQRYDVLAALIKIRVRKFEECCVNIEVFDPLLRQMAMRIKLAGNKNIRSDDCSDAFKQVTFAVIVALRNHSAMKTKDHCIDRHRRFELIQDLIAQFFKSLLLKQAARFGPCGSTFNDS